MDFVPESIKNEKSKEIHVELSCNISGLVARLNYKLDECVCPKKKDEQTFCEVQGMAPSAKVQVKQEATSCSLLPEVSEKCSLVSKAILNNLLNYYKDCVGDADAKETTGESIRKIKIPEMFSSNETKAVVSVTKKTEVNTAVTETTITTIPAINVTSEPKSEPETPIPCQQKNKSPSDSFIESLEKTNIATSSPNEKVDDFTNRDASVVQALNEARSKIDQALLCMKLNVTQDLSMASTAILMTTPQVKQGPRSTLGTPGSMKRAATATEITQHKASAQKVKQGSTVGRKCPFLCIFYNFYVNLQLQVVVVLESSQ